MKNKLDEPIEIKKPPTSLYYWLGVVLLFFSGFAAYYFIYYRPLQKEVNRLVSLEIENINSADQNVNHNPANNQAGNINKNENANTNNNANTNTNQPTSPRIYIDSPKEGDTVSNPITIRGRAEVFEATFNIRIRDGDGKVLAETIAMTSEGQVMSPYEINLIYATSTSEFGLIEAFDYSAKDGSIEDLIAVKVKISPSVDCPALEAQINQKIDKANYCTTDVDCIIESFSCPFSCGSYLNKNYNVEEIRKDIEYFLKTCIEDQCVYSCLKPLPPVCLENKCIAIQCELDKEYRGGECQCPEGIEFKSVYNEEKKDWFYVCPMQTE